MASRRPKFRDGYRPATPAQLEDASKITPGDIVHAAIAWERDAPPPFRKLLNAKQVTRSRPAPKGSASGGPA